MIDQTGSRLAIVIILLAVQTLILVFEIVDSKLPKLSRRIFGSAWRTRLRQYVAPIGVALLGIVLISITFSRLNVDTERAGSDCTTNIDADIAGMGVRIAAFIQVCTLVFVSLFGTFHSEVTGIKELGAGLMITTGSLAIALIVRLRSNALNLVDAAIGAMILDGQTMALSIPLTSKDTLASRWQTWIAVAIQFFGIGTVIGVMSGFNGPSFVSHTSATDYCKCLKFFWWGWLGNCGSKHSDEFAVFWIYCACRFVCVIQATFHALCNTSSFDLAEKHSRETSDRLRKLGGPLFNVTYPHLTNEGRLARYGEYPAVVTFTYLLYGMFAINSLANAQVIMNDLKLQPSSNVASTGQVIALVIAGVTLARAGWLFFFMFRHEDKKKKNLVWPFKLQLSKFSDEPGWIVPMDIVSFGPWPQPGTIEIGNLLTDPQNLASKCTDSVQVSPERRKTSSGVLNRSWSSRRSFSIEACGLQIWNYITSKSYDRSGDLEITEFEPKITDLAGVPMFQSPNGSDPKYVVAYLVVGLKIVKNLRLRHEERYGPIDDIELNTGMNAGMSGGISTSDLRLHASLQASHQRNTTSECIHKSDYIYAYKVRELIVRNGKPLATEDGSSNDA